MPLAAAVAQQRVGRRTRREPPVPDPVLAPLTVANAAVFAGDAVGQKLVAAAILEREGVLQELMG